jgi:hypothetical protein
MEKTPSMKPKRTLFQVLLAVVVMVNTACSLVGFTAAPPTSSLLTIDQVAEGGGPGRFLLSGKAALPGEVNLTVSAVRRLNSADGVEGQPPLYGILDRKTATLEEGRWQATLMLWEPNAEGYYQEPWQRPETALTKEAEPNPTVDFLVTVEPEEFSRSVTPAIPNRLEAAINELLHFTPDGEPYLRVITTQPLPLPNNVQASRLEETQPPSSPWQGRSALDATNTAIEQISEPPFLQEDNLPITQDRLMR